MSQVASEEQVLHHNLRKCEIFASKYPLDSDILDQLAVAGFANKVQANCLCFQHLSLEHCRLVKFLWDLMIPSKINQDRHWVCMQVEYLAERERRIKMDQPKSHSWMCSCWYTVLLWAAARDCWTGYDLRAMHTFSGNSYQDLHWTWMFHMENKAIFITFFNMYYMGYYDFTFSHFFMFVHHDSVIVGGWKYALHIILTMKTIWQWAPSLLNCCAEIPAAVRRSEQPDEMNRTAR